MGRLSGLEFGPDPFAFDVDVIDNRNHRGIDGFVYEVEDDGAGVERSAEQLWTHFQGMDLREISPYIDALEPQLPDHAPEIHGRRSYGVEIIVN